jgi:hypothetical protein
LCWCLEKMEEGADFCRVFFMVVCDRWKERSGLLEEERFKFVIYKVKLLDLIVCSSQVECYDSI